MKNYTTTILSHSPRPCELFLPPPGIFLACVTVDDGCRCVFCAINRKLKGGDGGFFASVSEPNSEPRTAGRKYNSPRQAAQRRSLGYGEKKGNGVRRSGAEEADSRIAPSIVRKSLALIQIKRAPVPARSVASLRSSPLSVGLRSVAGAPSLRAQFHFFYATQGYAADAAPPWAITLSPRVAGL